MLLYDLDEIIRTHEALRGGRPRCSAGLRSGCVSDLVPAERRDRDADLAAGPRHHIWYRKPTITAFAPKSPGDELGFLVDRFNEMLRGIQLRDNNISERRCSIERRLFGKREGPGTVSFMAESMPQKIFTATPRGNRLLQSAMDRVHGVPFEQMKDGAGSSSFIPRTWRRILRDGGTPSRPASRSIFSTAPPRRWSIPVALEPRACHAGYDGKHYHVDRIEYRYS